MALNKAVFKTRALTALVFVVIMLVALLYSYASFVALCIVLIAGCWYEFFKLIEKIDVVYQLNKKPLLQLLPVLTSIAFALSATTWADTTFLYNLYIQESTIGLLAASFLSCFFIKSLPKNLSFIYHIGGLLYIGVSIGCLLLLRDAEKIYNPVYTSFNKGLIIPLSLIGSIWINDTMAYLVGSFIGKTPFSKISPKKTWEGTIGGAILAILVVCFITVIAMPVLPISYAVAISATAAIMGTIGDLFESKLKRMANVKDSGNFMPGHGGFLDRFDSLLVATPFVYLILQLLQ